MSSNTRRGRPKAARETKNVTLKVTQEAWALLDSTARSMGLTRSELVERFARGELLSPVEIQSLGKSCAS